MACSDHLSRSQPNKGYAYTMAAGSTCQVRHWLLCEPQIQFGKSQRVTSCACRYGLTDEQKTEVETQYAALLRAAGVLQGCTTLDLTGTLPSEVGSNGFRRPAVQVGASNTVTWYVVGASCARRKEKLALLLEMRVRLQQLAHRVGISNGLMQTIAV